MIKFPIIVVLREGKKRKGKDHEKLNETHNTDNAGLPDSLGDSLPSYRHGRVCSQSQGPDVLRGKMMKSKRDLISDDLKDQKTLQKLIEKQTLYSVLSMIVNICDEKADNPDDHMWHRWEDASFSLNAALEHMQDDF